MIGGNAPVQIRVVASASDLSWFHCNLPLAVSALSARLICFMYTQIRCCDWFRPVPPHITLAALLGLVRIMPAAHKHRRRASNSATCDRAAFVNLLFG